MNKIGFLFPILFILMFTLITPRVFAGAMSPSTMVLMGGAILVVMMLFRPKKAATKTAQAVADEIMDDFSADAFDGDEVLRKKFYAALSDLGGNMPKGAVSKLQKLAPLCTGKKEQYAVAMATALCWKKQNNHKNAVREYNKAVIIHPSASLAFTIGDCYQRLGELDKARDSYEFAQELEPGNAKYPSCIATTYVGDGNYNAAMDYAAEALDLDETYAQALATMAICHGMQDDALMHRHYLKLAADNGYSQQKILDTVKALKKRQ